MTLSRTILHIAAGIVFVTASALRLRSEPAQELPLLTLAQQVRELSPEEAERRYPVRLRALVMYYDQTGFRDLSVQDSSAGIYVDATDQKGYRLSPGDVVEVEGCSAAGGFAPVVLVSNLVVVGRAPLPQPRAVSYEQLATGAEDGQWVTVQGIVRAVRPRGPGKNFELDLAIGGRRIDARVRDFDPAGGNHLVDAEVSLDGICFPVFNRRRQLLDVRLSVPGAAHIQVKQPAPSAPFDIPTRAIKSLRQFQPQHVLNHRVKVEGQVMLQDPGKSLFIRDATQALWVKTSQTNAVAVGDRVEVIGFPTSIEYSLILEDSLFKRVGPGAPPVALTPPLQQVQEGLYDSELVQLEAQLLEWIPNPTQHVLVLQQADAIFYAYLPRADGGVQFKPLPALSRVRLSGICLVQVGPNRRPRSFQLLLRSSADLMIIGQPPWWSPGRVLWVVSATALLAIVSLGWVGMLKREVRRQTRIIQQKIEREAVLEERTRIAREFHDTIEQQLAAVTLQLQAARVRVEQSPDFVRHVLQLADSMLRHAQSEARHSVWDLRARALENGSLPEALSAVANYAGNGSSLKVRVTVTGAARPLPAQTENHLLRIGQEAATNAVKHGGARNLHIRLHYETDTLKMAAQDDGKGFDVASAGSGQAGHFGLLGIRERAEKIGAQLAITSTVGQGTEITVTVPLAAAILAAHNSA